MERRTAEKPNWIIYVEDHFLKHPGFFKSPRFFWVKMRNLGGWKKFYVKVR